MPDPSSAVLSVVFAIEASARALVLSSSVTDRRRVLPRPVRAGRRRCTHYPSGPRSAGPRHQESDMTTYRTIQVNGPKLFYREAGDRSNPTLAAAARLSELLGAVRAADRPPRATPARDRAGSARVWPQPPAGRRSTFDGLAEVIEAFIDADPAGAVRALHVRFRRSGRLPHRRSPSGASDRTRAPERQRLRSGARTRHAGADALLAGPRRA